MKKIFILIALITAIVSSSYAQEASKDKPASPAPKKKAPSKERLLIAFTADNWLNGPCGVDQKVSIGFTAAALYDKTFGASRFSAALGLGFSSHNVHSDAQPSYTRDNSGDVIYTSMTAIPDSIDYKKNKLSLNYLEIPFELRFRSKPDKSFRRLSIAAGFKAGYLIQSHTKYKGDDANGNETKFKTFNISNLNKLRYGPTFRMGYGKVSLFGYLSISELFQEDKGPIAYPFSAGIMIIPY